MELDPTEPQRCNRGFSPGYGCDRPLGHEGAHSLVVGWERQGTVRIWWDAKTGRLLGHGPKEPECESAS